METVKSRDHCYVLKLKLVCWCGSPALKLSLEKYFAAGYLLNRYACLIGDMHYDGNVMLLLMYQA